MIHLLQLALMLHPGRQQQSRRSERGSVTMEHVLWAVAVIVIVGIVVAAVTSYVTDQSNNIK